MVFGEKTLSGSEAIKLIEHPDFLKSNFYGAVFNEGKDDSEDEKIISFQDGFIFTESRKYGLQILQKGNAELIFPDPSIELLDLISSLKSVGERRQETVDNNLASIGFPINIGTVSLEKKEFLWTIIKNKNIPSQSDRSTFFEIAKKSTNLNWALRFFENWLRVSEKESQPEALGRMHLAYIFRQIGLLKQALQTTNVVEFPRDRFKCPPHLMSILATIRAAIFLDIFEHCNDRELLIFARKTLNKSWAINKSDEASNVYQRLQKLERYIETEDYKEKIDKAYLDWASWG